LAMVCRGLEEHDAIVRVAASCDQALRLLEDEPFDVIVSDIAMPGRDGYSLMAEVRLRGIETPALALTAFAQVEDRTRSISSGYQAHLSKPVEIDELVATIASLVGRRITSARRANLLP